MSFDPTVPFRYSEARADGWSRQRLNECTRLGRGLLLDPETLPTARLRALAALEGLPDSAYVSHHTAARLLNLPLPAETFEHATVGTAGERRKAAGRTVHVRVGGEVALVDGIRSSAPRQVWEELGGSLGLIDHVVLGDAICRRGWMNPADFSALEPAAPHIRPCVDSPMETRLRMLIVLAGLPEPEVNPAVRDEFGNIIRRYDLYYRKSRTVVEYDGRHHIERQDQWTRDLGRREDAETGGDRFLVVTSRDVYRETERLLERIASVLRQRGEPRVPALLRHEWRLHGGR